MEPEDERMERAKRLIRSIRIVKEIFTIIMALAFTNTIIHFFVKTNKDGIYVGKYLSEFGCVDCWILFLIVTTIIRFYHGNSIHLDNMCRELLLDHRIYSSPRMEALFLISESIIFALMSIYQFNVEYLFWLFAILFGIDFILFYNLMPVIYKESIRFINSIGKSIRERVRKPLKAKKLMELRRYSVMSILKQACKSLDDLIYRYRAETKWMIVNTVTVISLLYLWNYRGGGLFVDHTILLGLWNYTGSLPVDHTILCGLLNYRGGGLFVDHTWEFLTIITLNLALDYGLNLKFYFPSIHGT